MTTNKIRTSALAASFSASLFAANAFAADAVVAPDPAPPAPVQSDAPISGWYIAARIGAAFADDTDFNIAAGRVDNRYDPAITLSGAVGYSFDLGNPFALRTEAELGYMKFEVDRHIVAGAAAASADSFGETESIYGLANAYLDYNFGALTPYIGAGIGYANVDFQNHGVTGPGVVANDSDSGLTWQVGLGAAYEITESWKLDIGYRYQSVENIRITAEDGTTSDTQLRNHQISVGVRKQF